MKNILFLLACTAIFLHLTACSLSTHSETSKITLQIQGIETSSTTTGSGEFTLPKAIGDFKCILVNVSGPKIDQSYLLPAISFEPGKLDTPVAQLPKIASPAGCKYPGITTKTVSFSGPTEISLDVSSGKSRTFQILGVAGPNGCPAGATLSSIIDDMINSSSNGPPYIIAELGSTTVDLLGDASVKISNSFDPNKVKFPFHCLDELYYKIQKKSGPANYFVRQIAAGNAFTCALKMDQRVQCWGRNSMGQLGRGFVGGSIPYPEYVVSPSSGASPDILEGVQEISAGTDHACARLSDQKVVCWGSNSIGQLGITLGGTSARPVFVTQPDKIGGAANANSSTSQLYGATQIVSGDQHNCALRSGDTPICWGAGTMGQIGNSLSTDSFYPREVTSLPGASKLAAGGRTTCAIDGNPGAHSVKCWGEGTSGQIGNAASTSVNLPTLASLSLGSSPTVSTLAVSNTAVCIVGNGSQYCWGSNTNFEYGNASGASNVPVIIISASYSDLFAGLNHMCGVNYSTRQLACWGANQAGQIGNGSAGGSVAPAFSLSMFSSMSEPLVAGDAGTNHNCVGTGANVWCWGENIDGELGPSNMGSGSVANPMPVMLK